MTNTKGWKLHKQTAWPWQHGNAWQICRIYVRDCWKEHIAWIMREYKKWEPKKTKTYKQLKLF